jgi:hypothetical protein
MEILVIDRLLAIELVAYRVLFTAFEAELLD